MIVLVREQESINNCQLTYEYQVREDEISKRPYISLSATQFDIPPEPDNEEEAEFERMPLPCILSQFTHSPRDNEPQIIGQEGLACLRYQCDGFTFDFTNSAISFDTECEAECDVPCSFDSAFNSFLNGYLTDVSVTENAQNYFANYKCDNAQFHSEIHGGSSIRFGLCCQEDRDAPYFSCSETVRDWAEDQVENWFTDNCICREKQFFQQTLANAIDIENSIEAFANWVHSQVDCFYPSLASKIPSIINDNYAKYFNCCNSATSDEFCMINAGGDTLSDMLGAARAFCESGQEVPTSTNPKTQQNLQ